MGGVATVRPETTRRKQLSAIMIMIMIINRGKLDIENWYKHGPKLVETCHEGKLTSLWNQHVQTDTTIPNINRTPLSVIMKKEYVC